MSTTVKMMTERELLNNIVDGAEITDKMKEKAAAMLEALDKKNSKRKETGTKNQQENKEIKEKIIMALVKDEIQLVDGYATTKFVSKYFNFSTQKASALLRQLVDEGKLENEEIKTKSGKVQGYKILESVKAAELAKLDENSENAESAE
jgi:hypothetical protein